MRVTVCESGGVRGIGFLRAKIAMETVSSWGSSVELAAGHRGETQGPNLNLNLDTVFCG